MLTFEKASELLSYDAATGSIRWLKPPARWIESGAEAGSFHKATGYRHICVDQRKYKAHRLAWLLHYGEWPGCEIDHVNGDRADNSIANLRLATYAQNQQNRGLDKRNTSGFTGVSWDKDLGKWRARICVNRKVLNLGSFETPEAAAAAYAKAKAELHTFNPVARAA